MTTACQVKTDHIITSDNNEIDCIIEYDDDAKDESRSNRNMSCCSLLLTNSESIQPMKVDNKMVKDENDNDNENYCRSRSRRRICFDSIVSTIAIPSRHDYSSEEKRMLWFRPEELSALGYESCSNHHQEQQQKKTKNTSNDPCFFVDYFFPCRIKEEENYDDNACISVVNGRAVNSRVIQQPKPPTYHHHPNNSHRRVKRVDSLLIRLKI